VSSLHAEVLFYSPTAVAVAFPPLAESDLAQASEIKLFSLYGGHVLADLGRDYYSQELVTWVERRAWQGEAAARGPLVWDSESWGDRAIGEVKLTEQDERKAKPRFEASLEHEGSVTASFFDLRLERHNELARSPRASRAPVAW
jgi:hypothetical protein